MASAGGKQGEHLRHRHWRRQAAFLRRLRRVHVRLGLWSALLGLCFGATGILLNHRATLRLRLAETTGSTVQLALPAGRPETVDAFATWARDVLAPPGTLPTPLRPCSPHSCRCCCAARCRSAEGA